MGLRDHLRKALGLGPGGQGAITVNGVQYRGGQNVLVRNGEVFVDGAKAGPDDEPRDVREQDLPEFDRVASSLPARIVWRRSERARSRCSGKSSCLDALIFKVVDGCLRVESSKHSIHGPLSIELESPAARGFDIGGAAEISAMEIDSDGFQAIARGAAQARLGGRVGAATLASFGSSSLDAGELRAESSCAIMADGSSRQRARLAPSTTLRAAGSAKAELLGSGGLDARCEGDSRLEGAACVALDAKLRCSGSSWAALATAGSCELAVDGAARIDYRPAGGSARLSTRAAGSIRELAPSTPEP